MREYKFNIHRFVQGFKISYSLHSRWEAKILNLNSKSTTQILLLNAYTKLANTKHLV